jgi:hypothetical protein
MAFADRTYVEETVGTADVAALTTTSAAFLRLLAQAAAIVEAVLFSRGMSSARQSAYDSTGSNCPELIRLMTAATWFQLANGRNTLSIPDSVKEGLLLLNDLREGKLQIPDVTQDPTDAHGGSVATTSTDSDGDIVRPVMRRSEWEGY